MLKASKSYQHFLHPCSPRFMLLSISCLAFSASVPARTLKIPWSLAILVFWFVNFHEDRKLKLFILLLSSIPCLLNLNFWNKIGLTNDLNKAKCCTHLFFISSRLLVLRMRLLVHVQALVCLIVPGKPVGTWVRRLWTSPFWPKMWRHVGHHFSLRCSSRFAPTCTKSSKSNSDHASNIEGQETQVSLRWRKKSKTFC